MTELKFLVLRWIGSVQESDRQSSTRPAWSLAFYVLKRV
jgi:hypothetical protein